MPSEAILVWTILTQVAGVVASVAIILHQQREHGRRIADLEKDTVTKDIFTTTVTALQREDGRLDQELVRLRAKAENR
jgi:hypothetical protein